MKILRLDRSVSPIRSQLAVAMVLAVTTASAHAAGALAGAIQEDYKAHLEALFEHFHRNPELSLKEIHTAARLARELRATGFEVTEGVGGTGVVALLRNGEGPLVMMRADMDGLPVEEKTGLPYASTATQTDGNGNTVPVMHACGHDVHLTSLVGTARVMASTRETWSGTLMLIGQPAEERVIGARMMRADALWDRFGKPDYALGVPRQFGRPHRPARGRGGGSLFGSRHRGYPRPRGGSARGRTAPRH